MRLQDEVQAARRSFIDLGGMISSVADGIMRAERFELTREVVETGHELMMSKPSSLLKAMAMVRMPYDTMWIEWPGGLGIKPENPEMAPEPTHVGCLLQALDDSGQRAVMTWAWEHKGRGVNIGPFGAVFDWRPEPNLRAAFDTEMLRPVSPFRSHNPMLDVFFELLEKRHFNETPLTREWLQHCTPRWASLPQSEIDALNELLDHSRLWLSPHTLTMMQEALQIADPILGTMLKRWEKDIEGEGAFMEVILALLNSKNAVEHETFDQVRLNKARRKAGKSPLLSYRSTRIRLTRSDLHRAHAAGISRAEARGHKVRGHFKLRSTGVFWWHSFRRGDRTRPMPEHQYEVVK